MASIDDHREWYNAVAERIGGYRKTWSSTIEGRSGEAAFEELLYRLIEPHMHVLDAGCGSGEFSLSVAQKVDHLTGLDFAEGMIEAARSNAKRSKAEKTTFVYASTRNVPFEPHSFHLAYSRRGPTSLLMRSDTLKPGSWMIGVHSSGLDLIQQRLEESGLIDIGIEEYSAEESVPTIEDLAAYWSRVPGHPNYSKPEQALKLDALVHEYRKGDHFVLPHWRVVWRARKPT